MTGYRAWGYLFTGGAFAWAVVGLWAQAILSLLVAFGFAAQARLEDA
jgi:hypothetical protein